MQYFEGFHQLRFFLSGSGGCSSLENIAFDRRGLDNWPDFPLGALEILGVIEICRAQDPPIRPENPGGRIGLSSRLQALYVGLERRSNYEPPMIRQVPFGQSSP